MMNKLLKAETNHLKQSVQYPLNKIKTMEQSSALNSTMTITLQNTAKNTQTSLENIISNLESQLHNVNLQLESERKAYSTLQSVSELQTTQANEARLEITKLSKTVNVIMF